jgi:hypothetical protein
MLYLLESMFRHFYFLYSISYRYAFALEKLQLIETMSSQELA